jgi:predicted metalloprotease with PDZ domain
MKKTILLIGLFMASFSVNAQKEIKYELSFPNAIHHEAEITMYIPNIPESTLKVRMSRSSPGRYATHEFGKNIYNLKAFDSKGKRITVNQPAGDEYNLSPLTPGSTIKITYTLFGNWVDGTYVGFDETHAHMNIPATFAFPIGMDNRPRIVKFNMNDKQNWKVATQLQSLGNGTYSAPNFQYFMDSPIELAAYHTASWQVKNKDGKAQTIHVVSHSKDDQKTIDNYAIMLKIMVDEHVAVWGELPTFDYGNYYFLHDVYPDYAGDGMEHRNSTVIVQRQPKIAGNESALLSTFSHEFFHAWNVERLRPKTLEPFNFEHANISDELWLAEGFTQYYGNLLLARAGFRTADYTSQTFGGIINTVLNSPGAKDFSPVQASRYAVFADAGVAIDQTNKTNVFTTYYTYGASVALALDLQLRTEFKLTLDDYMRALWKAYGKIEIAYNIADLEKTLGILTKNQSFASNFFKDYIWGTEKNNFAKLLLNAGYILRKASPNKAYTGLGRLVFENGKAVIGQTTAGSPAYIAGLDFGATLLTADGVEIKDQTTLNNVTDAHKPGDVITVTYSYYGDEKKTSLTFSENPMLEVVPIEKTDGNLTPAMKAFRDSWLTTQVKK